MTKLKTIVSFVLIFISLYAFAQNDTSKIPVSIEISNNSTKLPGSGYVGIINVPIHPGITIGTYKTYSENEKRSIFQTFKLAYFYHHYSHHAFHLYSELGYKYKVCNNFSVNANIGIGYLHSFADVQSFKLSETGSYEKTGNLGRSQFTGGGLIGLNYSIPRENKQALTFFINYRFWVQAPFVKEYVLVLPYTTISIGTIVYLSKK